MFIRGRRAMSCGMRCIVAGAYPSGKYERIQRYGSEKYPSEGSGQEQGATSLDIALDSCCVRGKVAA